MMPSSFFLILYHTHERNGRRGTSTRTVAPASNKKEEVGEDDGVGLGVSLSKSNWQSDNGCPRLGHHCRQAAIHRNFVGKGAQ